MLELKVTIGIGFEDITVVVADCFGKFSLSLFVVPDFLRSKLDFKSLIAEMGTFGVLTGNMGEFVRERDPKNRDGFSGLALGWASNLALPLATAPAIFPECEKMLSTHCRILSKIRTYFSMSQKSN